MRLHNITKNQHYVPQFLLRNFATAKKRSHRINVLDLVRDQHRPNQNVAEVCSENYFYDKDNVVEKFLEKHVETPAAKEISALCSDEPTVGPAPSHELARFITVQIARTAEALSGATEFLNGMTTTMFREMARLNGLDEEAAAAVQIRPTEPRAVSARLALNGCIAWILVRDLSLHLLINDTPNDFIISDHPVAQSNLLLRGANFLNSGSLSVVGAQIFMPISARRMLCLYDPKIYKYGDRNSRVTKVESTAVCRALNSLQIRNGASALMFRRSADLAEIQTLCRSWRAKPLWEHRSFFNKAEAEGDGTMRSLHAVTKHQTGPEVRLPFFKLKRSVRRKAVRADDRDPVAVKAFDKMIEKLKAQRARNGST